MKHEEGEIDVRGLGSILLAVMLRWVLRVGVVMFALCASAQSAPELPVVGTLKVRGFAYEGQTVFTAEQINADAKIAEILARNGGELSLNDLEEARQRITMMYIEAGFINSGAILPDQTIDAANPVVRFTIVEGRLNRIELEGRPRLREGFIKGRVWPDADRPLNALELADRLEILRQNPNIQSINAELKPGLSAGQATLDLRVTENTPWQVGLQLDNNRSPSVGAERLSFIGSHTNVLGFSDSLLVRWGLTTGDLEDLEFAELDDINAAYSIPINRYDTTLQIAVENSDSPVVEEPFAELNIRSRTQGWSVGVRQPIRRTVNSELAASLTLNRRDNKSFLAGEPFSFSPGARDGRTTVTALRFGQEFTTRTQDWALAVRSTFTIGLDALGATTLGDGLPDSQYFAWLAQAQYVRRLKDDWTLIVRGTAQLTGDALLPLEQFSLGGMDSVRGYRENQLVRDSAVCATVELRVPLLKKAERSLLEVAFFADAGYGDNNDIPGLPTQRHEFISSVGLGMLWNPTRHFSATVYWGLPFKEFDQNEDDLQDWGVHFSLLAVAP